MLFHRWDFAFHVVYFSLDYVTTIYFLKVKLVDLGSSLSRMGKGLFIDASTGPVDLRSYSAALNSLNFIYSSVRLCKVRLIHRPLLTLDLLLLPLPFPERIL